MNGRRLSVYTNTSHVQNVDAAAVPRMWALEDQLVTTQDILAEQLEARKQLERELATSKLEIERMRLELQQQQVQQQQQKEQEQEQAISTSGLDRADFPQAVDMDMPNDALEATDRFGDSPHTLISSQHKQTNSSDMSNSSHSRPTHRQSLQSIPSFTADPTDSPRRRSSSFLAHLSFQRLVPDLSSCLPLPYITSQTANTHHRKAHPIPYKTQRARSHTMTSLTNFQ
ncbi:hypothetical protein BASA83_001745 [Batrachochytrium salamandrivorans]|nr:hypothetical protein BASA83_001745 [Batrachochytrium salamandrivorans]